jgi:hypothetical protein
MIREHRLLMSSAWSAVINAGTGRARAVDPTGMDATKARPRQRTKVGFAIGCT